MSLGVCRGAQRPAGCHARTWGPPGGCQRGVCNAPRDLPGIAGGGGPLCPEAQRGSPAGVLRRAWGSARGHRWGSTAAPEDQLGVTGLGLPPHLGTLRGSPAGVCQGSWAFARGRRLVSMTCLVFLRVPRLCPRHLVSCSGLPMGVRCCTREPARGRQRVCRGAGEPSGGHRQGFAEAPGGPPGVARCGPPPCPGTHQGLLAGVGCCAWWPAGGHRLESAVTPRDQLVVTSGGV